MRLGGAEKKQSYSTYWAYNEKQPIKTIKTNRR
jgi:hypothetical protein